MARKSSGLNTAIKIVKAIDKAHNQAVRESERLRKQRQRENARRRREQEQMLRQQEREQIARERVQAAKAKEQFKKEINKANRSYEKRCIARQQLRDKFVNLELR